ncbi:Cupredoxin [Suillus subaureus]|uniref:Cupredoxin n=1 Tax=Suillus subaureus TaxID=48587 RepID=A0A9P7JK08_9AGAM|nr:Cupredoxin [Suillus subaureus]KAG1826724.1 Cupredoxin [Suillus subaureus]
MCLLIIFIFFIPLLSCELGSQTKLTVGNKVIAPNGFERSATLVNGVFPGPLISAELTDTSMFTSTSVHWHGIYQNGTSYANGTSSVTQCPIAQNHSYLHSFSAQNQAGTFWYHSHYSIQYASCDGLRGPLVIYDPDDPRAYMYDVDDAPYHAEATILRYIIGNVTDSVLVDGLGRYAGGPMFDLAVISVEQGKRYHLRLVSTSCDSNFQFSIDGYSLTVIEVDGQLTEPLVVDQLQIYASQRYSVVLVADQRTDNYWIPNLPNTANASFKGGTTSAILRYKDASQADPTTINTTSTNPLLETNLHALINPGAPGIPEYGAADINLNLQVSAVDGNFYINNVSLAAPTVPVLLQILSGAQDLTQLMPNESVIIFEANKVVELTLSTTSLGGPGLQDNPFYLIINYDMVLADAT